MQKQTPDLHFDSGFPPGPIHSHAEPLGSPGSPSPLISRALQTHPSGNHAQKMELFGADGVMICTNTMHKLAPMISKNINIPLLHIADATAQKLIEDGVDRVGLLGTAFTMEQEFYRGRLTHNHGLEVLTPDSSHRAQIHKIIYDELCLGIIKDSSRDYYSDTIADLQGQGAEAVILGCTEIGLLIAPEDSVLPVYDTTKIHAQYAVDWMVS